MQKIIHQNKKARHDYEIVDNLEAGIVLIGSEVKSVREGRVNLADAYARFRGGELWLIGMHISAYKNATMFEIDPLRDRKLLLNRMQLKKLQRQVEEKGMTLIPLKVYLNRHLVKIDLGLARGKKQYDKRAAIAEKDMKRDSDRSQKMRNL